MINHLAFVRETKTIFVFYHYSESRCRRTPELPILLASVFIIFATAMTLLEKNWPLSIRALFIALLISILASTILGLPITRSAAEHLEQEQADMRHTLTRQVSLQAAEAIFSQDLLSLNVILSTLTEYPNIRYAAVYDLNNKVVAEQGSADDSSGIPMSIQYQNEVIGLLEIRLNDEPLKQRIWQLYGLWLILSLLFTTLCALAAWFVGHRLGVKLEQSRYELEHLGAIKQVTQHQSGEFKDFSDALAKHHQLNNQQRALHQSLGQYMQPQLFPIWQNRELTIESDYQTGAVLFFKLANLEQVQQQINKFELAELLNQHYALINQAAKLYNGTVVSYEGDGVMVLFNQEQSDQKHSFHGVCTGLLALGLIDLLNQARIKKQQSVVAYQLALHCGDILTRRFPNTAQADAYPWLPMNNDKEACNGAALLCEQSEANSLLMSKTCCEQGQLASQLALNKHHNLVQLNQPDAVVCYWVDHLTPNYQALIERQIEHISAHFPSAG
ncbi:adenylate/guanylate cyclase domain-containing protein [Pseudomonas sp. HK3]